MIKDNYQDDPTRAFSLHVGKVTHYVGEQSILPFLNIYSFRDIKLIHPIYYFDFKLYVTRVEGLMMP